MNRSSIRAFALTLATAAMTISLFLVAAAPRTRF
jgi:hypothetical protein